MIERLPKEFRDPTEFKDLVHEKVNEIVDWANALESERLEELEEELNLLSDMLGPRSKSENRRRRIQQGIGATVDASTVDKEGK